MNSTEMSNRRPPPSAAHPWSARPSARAPHTAVPTVRERLDEILPLLDFVPEAGPPVLFVIGPWLFVVFMLIGPLVLLATLVLATVIFVVVAAAICALPYLLVHHLRGAWRRHRVSPIPGSHLGGPNPIILLAQPPAGRLVGGRNPLPSLATQLHRQPQPDVTSNGM